MTREKITSSFFRASLLNGSSKFTSDFNFIKKIQTVRSHGDKVEQHRTKAEVMKMMIDNLVPPRSLSLNVAVYKPIKSFKVY